MAKFGDAERNIVQIFNFCKTFNYHGENYTISTIGKPTCSKGEPKTDIYINAISQNNLPMEFKITFKKENADFIENKTNSERALALFGDNWSNIISDATKSIRNIFEARTLVFKSKGARTEEGAITVGWKYELLNKSGGDLSGKVELTKEQIIDVYAGTNLPTDKKDASVNGIVIKDCGIANFLLMNDSVSTSQEIIDNLISVVDYVEQYPTVYFACKALNYRTYKDKFDGNRPLSVYVNWSVLNGKLHPSLVFDNPLNTGGNAVVATLKNSMKELNIVTTKDINDDIITNSSVIKK